MEFLGCRTAINTALAAELANEPRTRRTRNADTTGTPTKSKQSRGELAALVFERLEQRQSLAEIVVGVRVDPETVRELFDQWCLGLTVGQLQMARTPNVPRRGEIARTNLERLAKNLAALPTEQLTRISVGRFPGAFQHDETEYAEVVELGGFHVSGPCAVDEITLRFGAGDCRITAYGFVAGRIALGVPGRAVESSVERAERIDTPSFSASPQWTTATGASDSVAGSLHRIEFTDVMLKRVTNPNVVGGLRSV